MAEFYIPIEMERNAHKDIEFRLQMKTETAKSLQRTTFNVQLQYRNKGESARQHDRILKITCDGNEVYSSNMTGHYVDLTPTSDWRNLSSSGKWLLSHDSTGGGSYSLEISLKADPLLAVYNQTVGYANYNGELERIDLSKPAIRNFTISADRYGLNAFVEFIAEHAEYNITSIIFELTGQTREQTNARVGKATQADASSLINRAGTYVLQLKKTNNLMQSNNIFFDLDAKVSSPSPLDSGATYSYSLTITAENGKSVIEAGSFTLPQKVTGLQCEKNIDMVAGDARPLEYLVLPENAEEPSVTFMCTDQTVATIDAEGNICAISDGMCQIIVETLDGGFTEICTVMVANTDVFPTLNEITYLTSTDISRIAFACKFVRDEMTAQGIEVPELLEVNAQGRGHPIKNIKNLFETIEANCQILRSVSPVEIERLAKQQVIKKQNDDWYIVVNEWIAFLNEIHVKLNQGGSYGI